MPATRTAPRRRWASAKAVLQTRSVVMMARAASSNRAGERPSTRRGRAVGDFGAVHFHANHAGGCGEHLRHRQLEDFGGGAGGGQRHGVAGAGGAVGVAGVHEDGADAAFRQRQMAAAEPDRRRLHAVAREHGGGAGIEAGDDQRQIVTLGLPDSGIHGRISVSQRQVQTGTSPNISFSTNR